MAFMVMPIYNVDQPVGKAQPNRADDVRLIQVMLNAMMNASNGFKLLPENGVYSDDLSARIREFQAAMNGANAKSGKRFKEDGIVHPMPGASKMNWDTRFASGRMSTMYALNYQMRVSNKNAHQQLGIRLSISEYLPNAS